MTGEEYLTECGWQRVDQSMGPSGWVHPSEPGVVRGEVDALLAQGTKSRRARLERAPDQWKGAFDDR